MTVRLLLRKDELDHFLGRSGVTRRLVSKRLTLLCHNPSLLLDFLVQRVLAKPLVVLLQLEALSGIPAILRGAVSRRSRRFSALQNNLNPLTFSLSHDASLDNL